MSNNKSSTIKIVWECGKFTCNEGIRNAMVRSRFENILWNIHFLDNTKGEKSDKG